MKKCLTKGDGDGIISKLSARAVKTCRKRGKFEGIWEKFPTDEACRGKRQRLRDEKRKLGARRHSLKDREKDRKKFLTKFTRCDRIN